jgi:hypothetical protein
VLGDRHRDAADVGLLEGVGADVAGTDLTGDGHDRHRVHVRVGQRGDQVRRARAGGGHADADLAGGLRVPGRGVPGALLVADQDVPDLGVEERVVGRQDRPAGDAEDHLDADGLQRSDEALRAGDAGGRLGGRLGHGAGRRLDAGEGGRRLSGGCLAGSGLARGGGHRAFSWGLAGSRPVS